MKLFLIILTMGTLVIGYSQVVNIPDQNFKTYLLGNPDINTNGDTEIQQAEAANFGGTIYCSNLQIADLTGIEQFPNIIHLFCIGNQLTTLDVSQNTRLTGLVCSHNQLTALDVSANVTLIELHCSDNQIVDLDLSQNTDLRFLYCSVNELSSLSVVNNTDLLQLHCGFNNLSHLDISVNGEIVALSCLDNDLTALNIANGNNINFFSGFGQGLNAINNPNLDCINIDVGFTPPSLGWFKDTTAQYSDSCQTSLNVAQVQLNNSISIYPNPFNSVVFIETGLAVLEVKIFDITGKTIKNLQGAQKVVDLSDLLDKVLFIQVRTSEGVIVKKLFRG